MTDWKFKKDAECWSQEFWYDLTQGGRVCPEELLEDKDQIKRLNDAIDIVMSFEYAFDEKMEEQEEDE